MLGTLGILACVTLQSNGSFPGRIVLNTRGRVALYSYL